MNVLTTAAQMRACDRYAIQRLKIPSIVLMENAGRQVAESTLAMIGNGSGKLIFVFCGKGNNGGDGFVAARYLLNKGARVVVIVTGKSRDVKGDAKANLRILHNLQDGYGKSRLKILELPTIRQLNRLGKPDAVIDALFGTGFTGAVRSPYSAIIKWMNSCKAPCLAVDVPSGVNTDNGEVVNLAVRADRTVTMGLRKIGLIVGAGRAQSGEVSMADIGIPDFVAERLGVKSFLVGRDDVAKLLPRRPFNAHKHSVGKIFVIAGSRGLTGAAVMVSESALRSGAGAVVLGTPNSVYAILAKRLTEVMVEPLEDTSQGSISPKALPRIQQFVDWADVVIIGPGLSRNRETQKLVLTLLAEFRKPILLDADGLNALATNPGLLERGKWSNIILTPHTGELARLIGTSSKEIERERITTAISAAQALNAIVVLKGAPTVTATPLGYSYVNSTGNPGMATAGSGDVLAGVIGGLWGQGLGSVEAAYSGVFLHGLAGDLARTKFGERSLLAGDIQEMLVPAFLSVERTVP